IAIAMAATAATVRFLWILHSGPQVAIALATVTRMDSLFIGAFCASVFRDQILMRKIRRWLPWIVWVGVGSFMLGYSVLLTFPRQVALLIYGTSTVHRLGDETAM